ncbi:MAG: DUF3592 domain-containing protein [Acidovorax sp.]|nr:MAG: DUF3592 domain-containing protein [Acidovorax sp.]
MKKPMGRLAGLLFSAVFAVAFGLGGYFAGLQPLGQTLWTAWEVRSWQPVPALVLSADLRKHPGSEGGMSYEVIARYRYQLGGTEREGTRVGLERPGASDNIGDWHAQWHRRLQQAQARNEPITVYVNPSQPNQSLIDPSIRWRLQVFRLPFAFVFTLVGVVAAGVFVWLLLGLGKSSDGASEPPAGAAPHPPAARSSLHGSAAGAWLFTLFWCGISFPMAALIWSDRGTSGWPKAFISVFVVIGVLLLGFSIRQTRTVWRYRGSDFTALPHAPLAGRTVEVTLLLPQRAAVQPGARGLRLRLAQYRVDDTSSGSPERQVETLEASAALQPTADGGLRLVARFALPADAPAHGARRSRERVDWRVELLAPGGDVELSYDLPVKAAPLGPGDSVPEDRFDRFNRLAAHHREQPIAPVDVMDTGRPVPAWPAGALLQELPDAVEIRFPQAAWRWVAVAALAALVLEWAVNDRIGWHGVVPPRSASGLLVTAVLLAFGLHTATRTWVLQVRDDGIVARRSSWMWSSATTVPGDASQSLVHKVLFSSGRGSAQRDHHAVYGRTADGLQVRLTPALPGPEAAAAVGQAIAQAWQDRRGGFMPGTWRPRSLVHSRPAAGWLAVAALVAAVWWAPPGALVWHAAESARVAAEARVLSDSDRRLMNAQDGGDAAALQQALRDGANPNLLGDGGSSMLMLAALRGQMAHVELLLQAGAQPDLRQTQKDSERGDTALLRALYGGHLAIAQRLVQSGASLQVRNRWDWGPVHMAAQSGCVPCLQWLVDRGQPLDEPAPASRGETPAMLAAARGRVEVLAWLQARGVDLTRRDPHGQSALDWARFGKQPQAEQWLKENTR